MLLCEQYHALAGTTERLQPEQVAQRLQEHDSLLWIDIEHPTDEELRWLVETFHFHPLAMEDVRNQRQRAKIDRYDEYYFFVLRAIEYHPKSHRVNSTQLDMFIGSNYLVTIHQVHLPALEQVRRRWEQMRLPRESTAYLFYLISDVVVDDYFPVVDEIGDRIDDLDKSLFASMAPTSLQEIFVLRKSLLSIRKVIAPLRDAFNELIRSEEGGTIFPIVQTRAYFNDVYDHVLRLLDFVDTNRDMLSGSLDAYQSSQSNRLNENMQRLTVIATVLATATVVTGYYGMNLQGAGINSAWRYGGHVVLIIVAVLAVLEIWLFRRKGWL